MKDLFSGFSANVKLKIVSRSKTIKCNFAPTFIINPYNVRNFNEPLVII